jgi:hypothetical protein
MTSWSLVEDAEWLRTLPRPQVPFKGL